MRPKTNSRYSIVKNKKATANFIIMPHSQWQTITMPHKKNSKFHNDAILCAAPVVTTRAARASSATAPMAASAITPACTRINYAIDSQPYPWRQKRFKKHTRRRRRLPLA
jgi:hypothetical protein